MNTLVIVERAHRGAVEQGYAHVLWLVRALRRQSPVTLLLRGAAVTYALDVRGVPTGPDYRATLLSLAADDAVLLVSATSLVELGYGDHPLLPGLRPVSDDEVCAAWTGHDRVWFL